MVTAEKWYEYQDNYKKYGLDMRADQPRAAKPKKNTGISPKDKAVLLLFIVIIGILGVGIIVSGAKAAVLKYEINNVMAENTEIKREIETLTVQLKTATNIAIIEQKAIGELGMIYPAPSSVVYLSEKPAPANDFAMVLKDQAYNDLKAI